MAAARFVERLNEQIGIRVRRFPAVRRERRLLRRARRCPRLAAFFYAQAVEERNHAMMMVQYLLDADAQVTIPASTGPRPSSTTSSRRSRSRWSRSGACRTRSRR